MNIKTISALTLACSAAVATQAQVIDPLNGTGGISYTTYLVNDGSAGAGEGVSFTQSGSGLTANYVGGTAFAEQALYLAPVTAFSTTFVVGDTLELSVSQPASSTPMDIGLAISGNNPVAGSRTSYDWASVSVRPSQGLGNPATGTIRNNSDVSGALVTGANVVNEATTSVSALYIQWVSADVFNLGYIDSTTGAHQSESVTFNAGSSIGSEIGIYSDLRSVGGTLGPVSNLTIVPEPSTLALCGMGFAGLVGLARRKK